MPEIRWHNNPIVFSDVEPSSSIVTEMSLWPTTDWKWFNTTNQRWYDREGSGWVMQGEAGLTGEYEGEIRKIKIVNGLVTEVELDA